MLNLLIIALLLSKSITVGKIEIEGLKALPKSEINNILRIKRGDRFYPPLFNVQKLKLIEALNNLGYFDARIVEEVFNEREEKVFIKLKIEEGKRYIIKEEHIVWLSEDTLHRQRVLNLLKIKIPSPYSQNIVSSKESEAIDYLRDKGYLNASINTILELDSINKNCSITFKVEKGKRFIVNEIYIRGNATVRTAIIEREIKLKEGDYISTQSVLESIRRIYTTGLFSSVYHNFEFIDDNHVNIIFFVEERKPRYVKLQGGIYPFSMINIGAEVGHRNLFDNNQNINLKVQSDIEPSKQITKLYGEMLYTEPYFLNTPLKFNMKFFGGSSKIDSSSYLGVETFLSYFWDMKSRSTIGAQWRKFLEGNYTDGITNQIIFSTILDKRDNILYPMSGFFFDVTTARAGGILGGDYYFFKYNFQLSIYKKIWLPSGVFSFRISNGSIFKINGQPIPIIEKFKVGGDGTLRGYSYSHFISDHYFLGNFEIRDKISKKVGLALFSDIYPEIKGKVFYSIGIGFRYFLPVGSLRIDWAYNFLRSKDKGYFGNLYINLGEMF